MSFKHLSGEMKKALQKDTPPEEMKNEYLFENLSLVIEPGTTNAIVGPSGFGKTTILMLMVISFSHS